MPQTQTKAALLSILLLLAVAALNSTHAQSRVGIRAGMNFSDVRMQGGNGEAVSTKPMPGYHLGLTVDIPLGAGFFLQPGALYSKKGFRQTTDAWFSGRGNELEVTASYLEVPLNLLLKPKLGSGNVLLGAGPYVAYGMGGKWEAETDVLVGDILMDNHGDVIFKEDVVDGEFGNHLYGKPWDFGANLLVGYEFFGTLSLQLNAQVGIKDLEPEVDGVKGRGSLKNKGYGISVGYRF